MTLWGSLVKRVLRLVSVAALVASGTALVSSPQTATAVSSDGALSVRVIRDVNGNGSYEPALEVGVAGIPVTVTAPDGVTAAGTTGADGTVKIATTSLTGGKYRIEATIPDSMSPLRPAPAGHGLSSLTEFTDVSGGKNVALTMGIWNPSDYCQANPTLVTACQRNAINSTVPQDPNARSLVTFPFTARGATSGPTQLEDQGSVGTVYGLAYRKEDQRIFSGAFAKRGTAYGPGGPGAVYATTPGGVTTGFAVVPNAGTTAHQLTIDSAFFTIPGTQSLGDVDISEDGSEMYVVNLNDKKLYVCQGHCLYLPRLTPPGFRESRRFPYLARAVRKPGRTDVSTPLWT
jgi:hypothetical protein